MCAGQQGAGTDEETGALGFAAADLRDDVQQEVLDGLLTRHTAPPMLMPQGGIKVTQDSAYPNWPEIKHI